jgi:hypothetical protein
MLIEFHLENLKGREYLRDLGVDKWIILKMMLKEQYVRVRLNSPALG